MLKLSQKEKKILQTKMVFCLFVMIPNIMSGINRLLFSYAYVLN